MMDCTECGTDHSDQFPGSLGEKLACLEAQETHLAGHAAQMRRYSSERFTRKLDAGRDVVLSRVLDDWPPGEME